MGHFGPKFMRFVGKDGRIYPSWRQVGTETGRMSCSKPNAQQLAPEVRRAVRAPEGRALVWADYAQAEIRILASASGDPTLVAAFRAGKDPYKATAANMFGVREDEVSKEQRQASKVVNFSFIYGATAYGIAKRLGISNDEGKKLMKRYFTAHPRVEAFLMETAKKALHTSETRTLTGRARRFGHVSTMSRKEKREVIRQAMNMPMQGSCADSLKLALALLYERRHECPGALPIIALHDELVVECDVDDIDAAASWLEKAMIEAMAEVLDLGAAGPGAVPVGVEVETGKWWGAGRPWSPPNSDLPEEESSPAWSIDMSGPARVALYTDYRDLSMDNYPQVIACEECAERHGIDLEYQDGLSPVQDTWCELC